ncbi:hypothetical protein [Rhodoferax sp.]|uniref:hypothetical protein n=1 Tax=Rhodoferax sp. TaxID=50421 RepID=UPI0027263218|nr:hypothetical protein [Rhodoferax sp.]MDO9145498.1 hypothetical protein [Rhodoferax sp.]MDP1530865.1 hypothetical protein [Rhodoferax sp.]MDP3866263.1 hypothetical protein [Rhodoferax sp.]
MPTLTERVDPPGANTTATQTHADAEALVKEVLQQLQPVLAQHLHDLNARMQSTLESLVRQTVVDALKTQNQADPNAVPGEL